MKKRSQVYADVLAEVRSALQGSPLGPISAGALVAFYGSMMRLGVSTQRISEIVRIRPAGAKLTKEDRKELADWFDRLSKFEEAFAELEVAVINIYYPGLFDKMKALAGHDIDLVQAFNAELSGHVDPEQPMPSVLRDFLSDHVPTLGPRPYESRLWQGPVLSFLSLDKDLAENVRAVMDTLNECQAEMGKLISDHWTLREIADWNKSMMKEVKLDMGDHYGDITNSNVVGRKARVGNMALNADIRREQRKLLDQIAEEVRSAMNEDAGELFESFKEEAMKEQPRKSSLKSLWDGLIAALPTLTNSYEAVSRTFNL